jgi:hypothetical protein
MIVSAAVGSALQDCKKSVIGTPCVSPSREGLSAAESVPWVSISEGNDVFT